MLISNHSYRFDFGQATCDRKVHAWMQFNALAGVERAAGKVAGLKTNDWSISQSRGNAFSTQS